MVFIQILLGIYIYTATYTWIFIATVFTIAKNLEAIKMSFRMHARVRVVSDSVPRVDCSPPGSSVHGILQARILEWVPMLFWDLLDLGIESTSLNLLHWGGGFFTSSAT